MKDPMLEQYNMYELLYEFHDKIERKKAEEKTVEQETDKIEEFKTEDTLKWIEEEEKRDRERELAAEANAGPSKQDEAWMLEQLKRENGEDFGDDVNISF